MNKQHKDPPNHKQEHKPYPKRRQWPQWPKEDREEMFLWAWENPDEAAGETKADLAAQLAKRPDVAAQLAEIRKRRPDLVAKLAEERSRRSRRG
jgi:hypothetical protein